MAWGGALIFGGCFPPLDETMSSYVPASLYTGKRDVKALKVLCDNSERGCEWTGTLQQLDGHLTSCEFAVFRCPNLCLTGDGKEVFLTQSDKPRHVETECPNRKHQCPHCKIYGKFHKVTGSHLDKCPLIQVSCPNECGTTISRHLLNGHYCECPNQPSTCKFAEIGCEEKPLRKDLEEHENDSKLHLSLAVETAVAFKKALRKLSSCGVFKMSGFRSFIRSARKSWISPSFTTHRGGYTMCMYVIPGGCESGRGTHVSVYIHLMRGENDDQLIWPFKGEVTVELFNQLEDKNHHRVTIPITDANDRVTDGEVAGRGSGAPCFIPHASLYSNAVGGKKCRYLKDDCLYFRVSAEVDEDNYKPWLTTCDSSDESTGAESPPLPLDIPSDLAVATWY